MKKTLIFLYISLSLCLVACTEVDLCKSPTHPHHSYLDFRFHWQEGYANNHSDSMMVVAVRPKNVLRYDFRVTSQESNNKGVMLSPIEERLNDEYIDESGNVQKSNNDKLWVRPGIYKFVAFGIESESYENCYVTTNVNEDDEQVNTDYSDLLITYRSYKSDAPEVTGKYGEWKSYNTYSDYISSFANPVYMDHLNYIDVPVIEEKDGNVRLDFSPFPITQHVTFQLEIEKEDGVVVDSIIAEISGVPAVMELSTALLRPDKSYKMLFKMNYPALESKEDSLKTTSLSCTGDIETTGIIRSASGDLQTGPGILSLAVYSHVLKENVVGLPPRSFYKVFYAGINLYNTLSTTKVLEWDEEKGKYKQVGREIVLEIGQVLKLNKDRIVNGGSDDSGVDNWFDGENLILDI